MPHSLKHDFEYALILSGDQLYQMDYNEILQTHIAADAKISIATLSVNAKDAPKFGILKTDHENKNGKEQSAVYEDTQDGNDYKKRPYSFLSLRTSEKKKN